MRQSYSLSPDSPTLTIHELFHVQTIFIMNPTASPILVRNGGTDVPTADSADCVLRGETISQIPAFGQDFAFGFSTPNVLGVAPNPYKRAVISTYSPDEAVGNVSSIPISLPTPIGQLVDLLESAEPANPNAAVLRLWADVTDHLHELSSAGIDRTVIDTLTTLGGALTGNLPNPTLNYSAPINNSGVGNLGANVNNLIISSPSVAAGIYFVIFTVDILMGGTAGAFTAFLNSQGGGSANHHGAEMSLIANARGTLTIVDFFTTTSAGVINGYVNPSQVCQSLVSDAQVGINTTDLILVRIG